MKKRSKVLIIGAGASGYSAACRFLEKGVSDIKVLEAQNRIGGRIHTTEFGSGLVEIGAQWCHGEKKNVVYEMAKGLHILCPSHNDYSTLTFIYPNGHVLDRQITDKLTEIGQNILYEDDSVRYDMTLGDYFTWR